MICRDSCTRRIPTDEASGGRRYGGRVCGGRALRAAGLQVDQDLFCGNGFEADGEIGLHGVHVGADLILTGGEFRNAGGTAFRADMLQVDENVFCGDGFEADGEVRLVGAHVGGRLDLSGGRFRNKDGSALAADGLQVDRGVSCGEGFQADGEVRLVGGHFGRLDLTGGKIRNSGGTALIAQEIQVNSSLHWKPAEVIGHVSFMFGSVRVWADSTTHLDIRLVLDSFRYERLFPLPPEVTAAQRISWLDRDPAGYSPQPFSQLASVYRAEGHDRAARQVLIASQSRRRRQHSGWYGWIERAWSGLLRVTVGYGYRPWLACSG